MACTMMTHSQPIIAALVKHIDRPASLQESTCATKATIFSLGNVAYFHGPSTMTAYSSLYATYACNGDSTWGDVWAIWSYPCVEPSMVTC